MPGSLEDRYVRVEVINGKNLNIPSGRIPAGIYISVDVDSRRPWKSATRVLLSDESVTWDDTLILSSHVSPAFSVEIRASYEVDRMLGSGEVVGKLQTSWDELLDHGDEPFVLSFPPVRGVYPSLTLKTATVPACDDQGSALLDSLVDCEIAQDTDAGHAQFVEYMTGESIFHLNGAVQHFQVVLDQCLIGHPDRAAALTNLACVRLEGYIRNDIQDIDSTISLFRDALALRPQGHPDHASSLCHLIRALNRCYSKEQSAVYIHESAQLCCKLLPLCPEGTYLRSIGVDTAIDYVIHNLPMDASDEGIHLRRVILELCPLGHQHRPGALYPLLQSLHRRFTQRGTIDDLDESIELGREAVSLLSEGHPQRSNCLNELAVSLIYRFGYQGTSHDLDEAISVYEQALLLRPVGHESRYLSLSNLGGALRTRFNKRGDIDDINRAISLHREALMSIPPEHPRRDAMLANLALALKTRYVKSHVNEDLNEAIDRYRESLRVRRHDHPNRHITLFNLSSALCSRFTQSRENEDIEEAVRLCQESLAALPSLHPDRCLSYSWLQQAYLSRYRVEHSPADLSLAVDNFRLSSRHPTEGLQQRIMAAWDWVVAAEKHHHASGLEAYSTYFDLLDRYLSTRSSIVARREATFTFRRASTLPVDAASCATRRDNLRQAVELVEHGRGQQWTLASRLRTPLEDLESTNPKLARTFSELNKQLSGAQDSVGSTDRAAADRAATAYRKLTEQWDAAVTEIRNLQGFSRFLLPPSYKDLQAAACQGPVIILIGSEYSCSAIIVTTSGEPHHVPLPSIVLADLENLKDRFARAIPHACRMGPTELRTDLIVLLRAVWDNIMLPIVDVLEHVLKLKHGSRIWLCPTAAFTSIPLHAAHPFQTKADRSGKEPCLEDLFICSYTPTLSALIRSRQMMKKHVPPSFIAIGQGQPGAGKGKELLAVDSELKLVRKLVPAMAQCFTLSGHEATRAGALEALQQNSWVHLACHGKQDHDQPYNSHFVMKDEPLTLLDIMEKDIPHAEFAFLSACHTAVGDKETPDEVIHLAAGLQFSGFKSVVGTLWEVDDAVAKHIVEAFYQNIFKGLEDGGVMDCTKAAWALNRATHAVKTKVPLEQRIVFIHIGV
ncbi:CHAT domain-containing protein [Suillus clintonianus]|uniref:CHAT domain-containing protein n=1 Tax=Suillus clintonianus TaxID=1904413 RepID=UPI001B863332|nr:CHAT domain-containing protein [Suillus clintonianus]KAG2124894.1 CHAT domain-containing protein [Suillus clintonianus]